MVPDTCTKADKENGRLGCEFSRTSRVLISETDRRVLGLEDMLKEIAKKLDRPPVWATAVIAGLTGTIGVLATIIAGFVAR